MESSQELQLQL